ncbi:MAG: hypothetical protein ACK5Q1_19465, partial [Limnobacter sp.]
MDAFVCNHFNDFCMSAVPCFDFLGLNVSPKLSPDFERNSSAFLALELFFLGPGDSERVFKLRDWLFFSMAGLSRTLSIDSFLVRGDGS